MIINRFRILSLFLFCAGLSIASCGGGDDGVDTSSESNASGGTSTDGQVANSLPSIDLSNAKNLVVLEGNGNNLYMTTKDNQLKQVSFSGTVVSRASSDNSQNVTSSIKVYSIVDLSNG